MSENGKPEVLPGDLITGPGVYMSRSNCAVEVRHWHANAWVAQWEDGDRIYYADGTRAGLYPMPDPYQLIRWVGPLAKDIPTTSEQIAEIEEQAEQPEPVQVCEGRWRSRDGEIRNVTPTPDDHPMQRGFPWWDHRSPYTWRQDGRYVYDRQSGFDLVQYLGPIEPEPEPEPEPEQEPEPEPQPQPVQFTEAELELRIRLLKQCNDNQAESIRQLQSEARDLRDELAQAIQARDRHENRIGYLETINQGQTAAVKAAGEQNAKLRELATNAGNQLEQSAEEISELRKSLDDAEKQLDQKDAQIRDLRIELEAAQEAPQPVGDEEREQIWDQATEQAGQLVIRWLRPLTQAMITQPDDRLCRFMAMTLSILPAILPHVLGYAEDEGEDAAE